MIPYTGEYNVLILWLQNIVTSAVVVEAGRSDFCKLGEFTGENWFLIIGKNASNFLTFPV